jgi:D-glycero-alpha-D-manno-heptose 1-phosphate guanylyltransferase
MPRTDEAIILAGGFGTRLRSIVSDVPKPLAPVGNRPFLAWLLDALAEQGMRRTILATGFMGEEVAAALGIEWRGMRLEYSQEAQPLGTGGAIAQAAGRLQGDAFFVLNGDTWLALDYTAFDRQVGRLGARLGIALASVPDVSRYGAVRVEQGDQVSGFVEKGQAGPGYINAGVYRVDRTLLADFPAVSGFSFETEVLIPLVAREAVAAYTHTKAFIDIGVPEDYQRAQREFGTLSDPGQ